MEPTTGSPAHSITRRSLMRRGAGLGALVGAATLVGDVWLDAPWAYADGPTTGLGTGTAPEQVHLTWGSDPTSAVTVSWASPAAMPSPTLRYSSQPITASNKGQAASVHYVTYTDGMNSETVNNYHVRLVGLAASSTYTYVISDGAAPANTFTASFSTAPSGRASYVFSSFGDLGTPSADLSESGVQWSESSDNAYYAVRALEQQAPLFHILNGDLCYANLNTNNQPEVWRDFAVNNQVSAANRPWMPCLGNHEIEFGNTTQDGGSAAGNGNTGWNGAYGHQSYQARYQLPDNGVDGFAGSFYSYQVGTVLFISLDADDVIYQDGGANYVPATSTAPLTATNPAISIPAGSTAYNREYTGGLVAGPDNSLVPGADTSATATGPNATTPNAQTTWLASVLKNARADGSTVDMIVVSIHQCALSSSATGNGSDLGLRQAWIPLFDQYTVDLVVNGHDHNYERTLPVRGYLPGSLGTVTSPNPGQTKGAAVFTRTPAVATSAGPFGTEVDGSTYSKAFDTSQGTVYLTLGGGGTNGPTNTYGSANGAPQAKVITQRNQVTANATGGYTRNSADSVEPALWSAQTDTADAYGFAVFSVDPGSGPGQTSIVMNYLHAPTVGTKTNGYEGAAPAYTTFETVVFGRGLTRIAPAAALPDFGAPAVAAVAGLAVGGAVLTAAKRRGAAAEH